MVVDSICIPFDEVLKPVGPPELVGLLELVGIGLVVRLLLLELVGLLDLVGKPIVFVGLDLECIWLFVGLLLDHAELLMVLVRQVLVLVLMVLVGLLLN
jgi:hypothetical protein